MSESSLDFDPELWVLSCCKTAAEHEEHRKIREAINLLKRAGLDVYIGAFKQ